MEIINKTPHTINIICNDGTKISLEPVLPAPRVSSHNVVTATYTVTDGNGLAHEIVRESPVFGEVVDLPEKKEGTIYIVSMLVASRANNRTDLVSPGRQIRNSSGQVIGCAGLQGKEGEIL